MRLDWEVAIGLLYWWHLFILIKKKKTEASNRQRFADVLFDLNDFSSKAKQFSMMEIFPLGTKQKNGINAKIELKNTFGSVLLWLFVLCSCMLSVVRTESSELKFQIHNWIKNVKLMSKHGKGQFSQFFFIQNSGLYNRIMKGIVCTNRSSFCCVLRSKQIIKWRNS